ncbi:hypothetical protein LTR56_027893 [Elasticomyces elasticus]|nr:hypothetical protein LTR56_027893 [Elasticomyces elasticus]KAK4908437.1 hypothetical protein LTR49_022643 [Elasticomyces elasticus]KAK5728014.1 hypothetical protein LTS12_027383 [Elasticomyces elasticus]
MVPSTPGGKHDIGATRHLGSCDDYRVASNGLKAVEYPEGKEAMDDISRKLYKSAIPRSGQTTDQREVQAAPKSQSNGSATLQKLSRGLRNTTTQKAHQSQCGNRMALRVPMATRFGHSGRRDTSAEPRYRNSRPRLRLEPTNKDDPDSELRLFRPAHTFKMTAYGMTFSLGTEVLTSYLTALIIGGHKRDTTHGSSETLPSTLSALVPLN